MWPRAVCAIDKLKYVVLNLCRCQCWEGMPDATFGNKRFRKQQVVLGVVEIEFGGDVYLWECVVSYI